MTRNRITTAIAATIIAMGTMAASHHDNHGIIWTQAMTQAIAGDDNRDGVIDEDESGWNCATMGNRVCGTTSITSDGYEADTGEYVGGYN